MHVSFNMIYVFNYCFSSLSLNQIVYTYIINRPQKKTISVTIAPTVVIYALAKKRGRQAARKEPTQKTKNAIT